MKITLTSIEVEKIAYMLFCQDTRSQSQIGIVTEKISIEQKIKAKNIFNKLIEFIQFNQKAEVKQETFEFEFEPLEKSVIMGITSEAEVYSSAELLLKICTEV